MHGNYPNQVPSSGGLSSHIQGPSRGPPGPPGVSSPVGPHGGPNGPSPHLNPAFFGPQGGPSQHGPPHGPQGAGPQPGMPMSQHGPAHFNQGGPRGPWAGPPGAMKSQVPFNEPQLTEAEFEEIMNRNRTVSSSAIGRAVSDAAAGEYSSAIETLVTAISLIKQSKVAYDERCKILISSLQDTLHGIEAKSYNRRERSRSRERPVRARGRRDRSVSRYRDRSRDRDRDRDGGLVNKWIFRVLVSYCIF